jgi:FKBP-type peptidyl-prolyl cis-trans isomerase
MNFIFSWLGNHMKKHFGSTALLAMSAVFMFACSDQSPSKDSAENPASEQTATTNAEAAKPADTANAPAPEAKTHDYETLDERFSYAYGVDLGNKFKAGDIQMNVPIMAAGMQAALGDAEQKMSDEEVALTLEIYRKVHMERTEAKRAAAAEKNKKEGSAFLSENAKQEGVKVTASGLQYKVITEGKGPKPKEEDDVIVHYRTRLIDGTEVDSSVKNNEPATFMVRQVILGWTEALQMMPEGSKWELFVPPELAYGESGSGEKIEPNAVLTFEVELIKVGLEQTDQ